MDEITTGMKELKVTRTEVENSYSNHEMVRYAGIYGAQIMDESFGFGQRLTYKDVSRDLNASFETCCTICLDDLENDTKLIVLPCQHYYHFECIDWYRVYQVVSGDARSFKCPLC